MSTSSQPTVIEATTGDIRFFPFAADAPDAAPGWYRLNGRLTNTLSATAQAEAVALGLTPNIPDATGRHLRRAGAIGSVFAGTAGATIAQANMPNIAYAGTTPVGGGHTHAMSNNNMKGSGNAAPRGGTPNNQLGAVSALSINAADNPHDHTFSMPTGGGGVPVQTAQPHVTAFAFVYLGT